MSEEGGYSDLTPDRRTVNPQLTEIRVAAARTEEKLTNIGKAVERMEAGLNQYVPRNEFTIEMANHTQAVGKIAEMVQHAFEDSGKTMESLTRSRIEPAERRISTLNDQMQQWRGMTKLLGWAMGSGWLVTIALAVYAFSHR